MRTCLINSHRPCCMPECMKESCQRQHVLNRWHSGLKQKRACFWALRGYQDPENKDQRRKLRSIIKPKHRCLVYTSKKKSVCSWYGEKPYCTWLQPHQDISDCADTVENNAHLAPRMLKKNYIHCFHNYSRHLILSVSYI